MFIVSGCLSQPSSVRSGMSDVAPDGAQRFIQTAGAINITLLRSLNFLKAFDGS
jgi:hypothetical protein